MISPVEGNRVSHQEKCSVDSLVTKTQVGLSGTYSGQLIFMQDFTHVGPQEEKVILRDVLFGGVLRLGHFSRGCHVDWLSSIFRSKGVVSLHVHQNDLLGQALNIL